MTKLLLLIALALNLGASPVFAQEKAPNHRPNKMRECNHEAGDRKSDVRRAFMKTCLSEKKARAHEKRKACTVDAAGKSGAARRAFMEVCMGK